MGPSMAPARRWLLLAAALACRCAAAPYECELETDSCRLSSLKGPYSLVYPPADATSCIFDSSTPYRFQVFPGARDKLLFYFQGGGACWSPASLKGGLCSTDASPVDEEGVFSSSPDNPYASYTKVVVLYCSGDLHSGNVVRNDWSGPEGGPVTQTGANNTRSVLQWVKRQQATGQLKATLTDLALMGCSAGSLGVGVWSHHVLGALSWSAASVTLDSYLGVLPPGIPGELMVEFDACSIFQEQLQPRCHDETLTMPEIVAEAMTTFRSVPFAYLQSKADEVQIAYYNTLVILGIGHGPLDTALVTPSSFLTMASSILYGLSNSQPNMVAYLVNSNQHCYTPYTYWFTADASGPQGNGTGVAMLDWAGALPLHEGDSITTECEGEPKSMPRWRGKDYCAKELLGKTFTEP